MHFRAELKGLGKKRQYFANIKKSLFCPKIISHFQIILRLNITIQHFTNQPTCLDAIPIHTSGHNLLTNAISGDTAISKFKAP
jgi:hypothetical protein